MANIYISNVFEEFEVVQGYISSEYLNNFRQTTMKVIRIKSAAGGWTNSLSLKNSLTSTSYASYSSFSTFPLNFLFHSSF